MKAISQRAGNTNIYDCKSHSFVFSGTKDNVYDALREILERYQKYYEQHPEIYGDIGVIISLPFDFLRVHQVYAWFIPFSSKINIILRFTTDIEQVSCKNSEENITLLNELGLSMSFKKLEIKKSLHNKRKMQPERKC